MVTYLIATAMRPKLGLFMAQLREVAKADGVDIKAILMVDGPGCANIAFMLDELNDVFAAGLCMALQPAKWCTTTDSAIQPGMFEDRLER